VKQYYYCRSHMIMIYGNENIRLSACSLVSNTYMNMSAIKFRSFIPRKAPHGASGIEGPLLSIPQRVVLGLGYVALPYLWGRLGRVAAEMEWNERM